MPSVSEILLQHGRDVAQAAATRGAARAQLAQTLGAIPGQVINNYQQMTQFADARKAEATQQKTREAQATTAEVGARTAVTNERDVNAYKDIIGKLPKVTENGLQLTDVEALNRELTAARIDPAPYVQHAQAMNTAFRAEFAAKQALVKTAVNQVAAAGNNPALADKTLDDMVAARSISAEDAQKYKNFYTLGEDGNPYPLAEQVARVGQLTKYLGNPRKPVEVSAGAQRFDPVTGEAIGAPVPKETTVGSFEDYVLRTYGSNPTPAQVETARAAYVKAGQAPPNTGSFEDYVTRKYGANPTPAQIEAAREAYRLDPTLRVELTPNAQLNATLQLRDRFVRETQAANTATTQLAQMRSSLAAVKSGAAAAGSQGVLVTFQKILDPNSVVRESEYARSSAGLSLLSRLEGTWEKIKGGGAGVPVSDLETFVSLADQFARNQAKTAGETKTQIDNIAKQYGLDPANMTRDWTPPEADAGGAPAVGTEGVVNGIPAVWDGKGWKAK